MVPAHADTRNGEGNVILAIDTATDWAGIALYDEDEGMVRYEETWWARRRHTTTLMARIDAAVRDQSLTPEHLTGIAVAIGPGSYTGLRVGLSVAKGLALALDIPLVGVPTLDVVTYPYRALPTPVCAIIQAGRTRVCWAVYPPGREIPVPRDGYHLDDVPTVARALAALDTRVYICGEVTPQAAEVFQTTLGERGKVGTPAEGLRRPAFLAEMGWQRIRDGRVDDPATLSPIYLRHPGSSGP